jgi:hypothetical protein
MRRIPLTLTLSIGLALVVVACASPAGSVRESVGGEPSVPQPADSEAPAASTASSDGGGGSGVEVPVFTDGPWTGGQGQTTTSGAVSWTTDAPITTPTSLTDAGRTILAYNTEDTFVTININSVGQPPFHASVGTREFSARAADGCQVTYTRADDSAVEGTFSCLVDEFYYYGDPDPTGEITIEGSFTATR